MLPSTRDCRAAFLLPKYVFTRVFNLTGCRRRDLARFATILGFIGMLRPHTFSQLQPNSFTLVVQGNDVLQPPRCINASRERLFLEMLRSTTVTILGFFVSFKSKTQLSATAYFPNLSDCASRFRVMCPVTEVAKIVRTGYFKRRFLLKVGRGNTLSAYLKEIVNDDLKVSPHALRIGGRTWYLSKNLEKQFVDYLGTWACSEASARYYRASPGAVLRKLHDFYVNLDNCDAIG